MDLPRHHPCTLSRLRFGQAEEFRGLDHHLKRRPERLTLNDCRLEQPVPLGLRVHFEQWRKATLQRLPVRPTVSVLRLLALSHVGLVGETALQRASLIDDINEELEILG